MFNTIITELFSKVVVLIALPQAVCILEFSHLSLNLVLTQVLTDYQLFQSGSVK